jgi:hypothetical protein
MGTLDLRIYGSASGASGILVCIDTLGAPRGGFERRGGLVVLWRRRGTAGRRRVRARRRLRPRRRRTRARPRRAAPCSPAVNECTIPELCGGAACKFRITTSRVRKVVGGRRRRFACCVSGDSPLTGAWRASGEEGGGRGAWHRGGGTGGLFFAPGPLPQAPPAPLLPVPRQGHGPQVRLQREIDQHRHQQANGRPVRGKPCPRMASGACSRSADCAGPAAALRAPAAGPPPPPAPWPRLPRTHSSLLSAPQAAAVSYERIITVDVPDVPKTGDDLSGGKFGSYRYEGNVDDVRGVGRGGRVKQGGYGTSRPSPGAGGARLAGGAQGLPCGMGFVSPPPVFLPFPPDHDILQDRAGGWQPGGRWGQLACVAAHRSPLVRARCRPSDSTRPARAPRRAADRRQGQRQAQRHRQHRHRVHAQGWARRPEGGPALRAQPLGRASTRRGWAGAGNTLRARSPLGAGVLTRTPLRPCPLLNHAPSQTARCCQSAPT